MVGGNREQQDRSDSGVEKMGGDLTRKGMGDQYRRKREDKMSKNAWKKSYLII